MCIGVAVSYPIHITCEKLQSPQAWALRLPFITPTPWDTIDHVWVRCSRSLQLQSCCSLFCGKRYKTFLEPYYIWKNTRTLYVTVISKLGNQFFFKPIPFARDKEKNTGPKRKGSKTRDSFILLKTSHTHPPSHISVNNRGTIVANTEYVHSETRWPR